ncbi:hypothetical protein BH11BAC3_BH11BAC3_40750 [soil metagenome]
MKNECTRVRRHRSSIDILSPDNKTKKPTSIKEVGYIFTLRITPLWGWGLNIYNAQA